MAKNPERLAFIDKTLVKTTGWALRGQRLMHHAPFGHWRTQTVIGALRHAWLDVPWVIDGVIKSGLFDLYVETYLVPSLRAGDVVIMDNLSSHKDPGAVRAMGEAAEFLPPQSDRTGPIKAEGADCKSGRPNL
jgi:hypothetical protein